MKINLCNVSFLLAMVLLSFYTTGCINQSKKEDSGNTVKIMYSVYDAAADENVAKEKNLKENYTVQDVVDAYLAEFTEQEGVFLEDIPEIKATIKKGNVTLSFSKELGNVGSGSESYFIGNLVNSIIANVDEANAIYINVNGREYSSGHMYFELDEIVAER